MDSKKIVCLGDSITWGFPYGPGCSWVNIASVVLGVSMINRGINGETAGDLLDRFEKNVISEIPAEVFVMAGTNDAAIGISPDVFINNVTAMITMSRDNRIIPILGLPVPSLDRLLENQMEKYRCRLRQLSKVTGIQTVDFSSVMIDTDGIVKLKNYMDDVHPSKEGYKAMAACFVEFYRKADE